MKFDAVFIHLKEFGKYQKLVYFLICIPLIVVACFMTISVFVLGEPNHRCMIPGYSNDTYRIQSDFHRELINIYIPPSTDKKRDYENCYYYVHNISTDNFDDATYRQNGSKVQCKSWVYDDSIFKETFVSKINLVCGDSYKPSLAKTIFFAGVLVGSLGLGSLSDIFGRKKIMVISFILMTSSSIALAFSPNYIVFVILFFLLGAANAGTFTTAFVIAMELVGPTKRKIVGMVGGYFNSFGLLVFAALSYILRDWKYILIAVGFPSALFWLYWWAIPESPRWLLSQGRVKEAEDIIRKAAKVNRVVIPNVIFDGPVKSSSRLWHLFKSRILFLRTIVIFCNWLVVSMTFYGLSLNIGNLGGDFYLNMTLSGLVELPAITLAIIFLDRLGRKKCYTFSMMFGGIACICTIFSVKYGGDGLTTALAMIGKLGSTAAFAIIYVFSAELFPTVVRNAGIGASSCCARIGVMASPYIIDSAKTIKTDFGQSLPLIAFGAASIFAGLLSLLLPETLGQHLPETIEDGELFGTKEYKITKEKEKGISIINDLDSMVIITKM